MHGERRAIGVFDSGVGGVSVLREMIRCMPYEGFLYYADSANAPYGVKSVEEVKLLSLKIADYLIVDREVKALVIACNTATSVAVKEMRKRYSVPIIGMEPALKPAVAMAKGGRVLVMATPMTIRESKFQELLLRHGSSAGVIPLPCPGLVELIEAGETQGDKIESYLEALFRPLDLADIQVVVLGCTHYTFVKTAIASFFGEQVAIVDGNLGTARHVKRVLEERGLLTLSQNKYPDKQVEWITSGSPSQIELLQRFLLLS